MQLASPRELFRMGLLLSHISAHFSDTSVGTSVAANFIRGLVFECLVSDFLFFSSFCRSYHQL